VTEPHAIEVANVGKRYTKYEDTPLLVSSLMQLRNRTKRSTLWALRGANFDIARGECVGVIGRNGSGKSTLLQMLAGVTAPSEGSVTVRGRVAPLISVGVGFHPELTGRENVYVNATILGLRREEVDARFDEIVDFAEVGAFIDTPVKFYSSGMFVRLGFSVSVLAEPDILLIDEVLAVGDLAFQLKCFERMEKLRESGTTILIVTHNLNAVRRMCDRAIVIHDGTMRFDGDTVEALSRYHELLGKPILDDDGSGSIERQAELHGIDIDPLDIVGSDGLSTRHIDTHDAITLQTAIRFRRPVNGVVIGLVVRNGAGVKAYSERWKLAPDGGFAGDGVHEIKVGLNTMLATGSYTLQLGIVSDTQEQLTAARPPIPFFVTGSANVSGIADLDAQFHMAKLDA
jgi:ABC-type polysaccharide/polyol phosphate transport system ATPase subunit